MKQNDTYRFSIIIHQVPPNLCSFLIPQGYTSFPPSLLLITQIILMFCCSPPHLELCLAKPELDFDNLELYSRPFSEIVRSATNKHVVPKYSSLRIDNKTDYQFRVGWDKQAQLQLQFCEPSREVHLVVGETTRNDEHLWRVLGEHEAHELRLGDRIKIGFTQLLVYSLRQTQREPPKRSPEMQSQSHCRYCLSNSYSAQDPLLSLCKCNGSVKYLHLSCFRGWAMTRLQNRLYVLVAIRSIGKLQCEICRQKWPTQVDIDGRMEGLLCFEDVNEGSEDLLGQEVVPYIVLETETLDQNELEVKVFIKIHLDNKFYLGDNENSSDLAIETIGVSPIHCFIHSENQQFFITDCGSTTGTLVSLHQQEIFTNKRNLFLQYSHLLIRLGVEQSFFACFSPQQEYKLRFRQRAK